MARFTLRELGVEGETLDQTRLRLKTIRDFGNVYFNCDISQYPENDEFDLFFRGGMITGDQEKDVPFAVPEVRYRELESFGDRSNLPLHPLLVYLAGSKLAADNGQTFGEDGVIPLIVEPDDPRVFETAEHIEKFYRWNRPIIYGPNAWIIPNNTE